MVSFTSFHNKVRLKRREFEQLLLLDSVFKGTQLLAELVVGNPV